MAKTPTPEQEQEYLRHKGLRCLFCQSRNIDAGCSGADGDLITVEITCGDCGENWLDKYTLTGVLPAELEEPVEDDEEDRGVEVATHYRGVESLIGKSGKAYTKISVYKYDGETYDLYDQDGECLNEGHPFYEHPPLDFILNWVREHG